MKTRQTPTALLGVATCLSALLAAQTTNAGVSTDFKSSKEVIVTQQASPSGWWMEVGPLYRGDMEMGISGGSYSQQKTGGNTPAVASGIGSASAYGDRTYTDGYVRRDAGTGNSKSIDPKATWYWGYNNASQYNSTSNTLSFHSTGTPTMSQDSGGSIADRQSASGVGLKLAAGRTLVETGKFKFEFSAGFEAAFGLENHLQTSNYSDSLKQVNATDTYDTAGITMPAAGYKGTYDGPFASNSDQGSPVISNLPSSRNTQTVGLGYTRSNLIKFDVTSDVYEIWLGPRVAYQPISWLSLYANPKLGAAFVNMNAQRTEQLTATNAGGGSGVVQTWRDDVTKGEWTLIGGVTAGANVQVTARVFIDLYAGYEWSSDTLHLTAGPNTVTLNPGGYTAGAAVGYKF